MCVLLKEILEDVRRGNKERNAREGEEGKEAVRQEMIWDGNEEAGKEMREWK